MARLPVHGILRKPMFVGRSFNGRTVPFEGAYHGSNPCLPASFVRSSYNGIIPVFQAGDAGSIPADRFAFLL